MQARTKDCVVLALALSVLPACAAWAGGGHGGGHGGGQGGGWGVVHRFGGAGFRGGYRAGFGGSFGGSARYGTGRGLPPVAGVIHESAAGRPYFSAYGHTNTGARFGGFARGGVPGYGPYGARGAFGHAFTGLRYGGNRVGALGEGRRRFAGGRGFVGGLGGGFGAGYGIGYGGYGSPGVYGQPGTYGGQGTYGTTATQSAYGGGGFAYRSEAPLAARFAEPPLGPSPYAPYSPGDRYAYAAAADVGPRVVNPYRPGPAGCACGPRREPTIYRYGVGTAY